MDLHLLKENLEKKEYTVKIFDTKEQAKEYLNSVIDHTTVGFGGSVTLSELNIFDTLKTHNTVYWHDHKPDDLSVYETRKKAAQANIYLSSVNAISMQGDIINIDYTGNRVSALSFGPVKVYLVIGQNKVVSDYDEAMHRARNIAAPLNVRRLKRKTPCATGELKCYDCHSKERLCRNFSILKVKPAGMKYEILLIKEDLGY